MVGILVEKPSAARNFAAALGGMKGTYNGEPYVIVSAAGHLYEFMNPDEMVPKDKAELYKNWDIANLPWDETDFQWKYCVRGINAYKAAKNRDAKQKAQENIKFARSTLENISNILNGCSEISIATDVDPTGEGQLLAWEILDELGLTEIQVTRIYHQDEAPASIQKAFKNRKILPPMKNDPEYKKALMRSKWDLLSMQWTRIATGCVDNQAMLRQGRLKSAMVSITGDGLKAVAEYKKIPYYQNRFRDENGNIFTNEYEEKYPQASDVPDKYHNSDVVIDKKENKATPPPRLIDLAKLAAMLAPKGIKSKEVLDVYQRMYENQVVSYPRTEDKYMTEEQFNELLSYADKIAALVGVDPAMLTHKSPRKTHIKSGCAHGANRPGVNVPSSLSELKKFGPGAVEIYEILAKNYLAMLCEDYLYEAHTGHLKDYPDFIGHATIPRSMGWKNVFQTDDDAEQDDDDSGKGLGQVAEPFAYEGFPKKPPTPTTKWLMSQLEKHDVGTGATRTSIYADVTNENTKYPLLVETKGKLSMSPYGEISYVLLRDTNIGSVKITEQLMSDMREVAEGTKQSDEVLHEVQDLVRQDREIMLRNKANITPEMKSEIGTHVVGKCPLCGKDIVEGSKGFGCIGWRDEENPCHFTVWKTNGLMEPSKKQFTRSMVTELLEKGSVKVKDLVSKKGNKFDGIFKLKEDGALDFELTERERVVIGKCPRCGRDVIEGAKGFGCIGYKDEENPCHFTIWKNNALLEKSKKSVTASMAKQLLENGSFDVENLVSSNGNKYAGTFTMNDDGERVNLEFSLKENSNEPVGKCPRCGRDVMENAKGFGCVGYKDEENKCSFFLSKTPGIFASSGKSLTTKQAQSLLEGKKIKVSGLKSKAGKSYSANFTLNDDGTYANLDMSFDEAKPKTAARTPTRTQTRTVKRR